MKDGSADGKSVNDLMSLIVDGRAGCLDALGGLRSVVGNV